MKLNIVIPMAGAGSRFAVAGYKDPKPLIPVYEKAMIELVINNLRPKIDHQFIFICQNEHVKKYSLRAKFEQWTRDPIVITIDGLTQGAACTVLKAKEYINNEDPLMIANSDQYIDFSIDRYLSELDAHDWDGMIMTMLADDPKWSYVRLNQQNMVAEVVEKKVISNEATVGIYNFKKGSDFVGSAQDMIAQNLQVNGEFYVAPTYNHLISKGKKIGIKNIGSIDKGMHGLGTPSDLEVFLVHPISEQFRGRC